MAETQMLLFCPAGQEFAGFEAALRQCLPADATLAMALPASALPEFAHAAGRDPEVPDALVRLADADDAPPLAELADTVRSRILTVTRHAILPGQDAVRLFFGLRRLPALSPAQFHDYWLNRHAAIGRRLIPPYTYHQLHADPHDTAVAARRSGLAPSTYDGIVEVHFPDVAALVRQLSRPEVAEEALADERNFIDHARSRFWAFRETA
ncbi:MAG: EthD domain-containing protein [Sphingomonadales bacterium]|nr:EthD domain-containing protein [Sphingomonadales bacterium]